MRCANECEKSGCAVMYNELCRRPRTQQLATSLVGSRATQQEGRCVWPLEKNWNSTHWSPWTLSGSPWAGAFLALSGFRIVHGEEDRVTEHLSGALGRGIATCSQVEPIHLGLHSVDTERCCVLFSWGGCLSFGMKGWYPHLHRRDTEGEGGFLRLLPGLDMDS